MLINKTVYTLGEIEISEVVTLMERNKCGWEYFVYITDRMPRIGNFQTLKMEKGDAVVLGVASSRRLAQKLVLHIITEAFALDNDIEKGLKKLTGS